MARIRVFLAAMVVTIAVVSTGCATPSTPVTPQPPAVQNVPVVPMPIDEKRAALPPAFPIEVPVPKGTITAVQEQGTDVWVYTVTVATTPEQLLDWYSSAYASANWAEAERSSGRTSRVLFQKGGAQSEVSVTGSDAGGSTAQVSIGIGVPVGETF